MAEIAKQITELIGRTPMLQLCNFQEDNLHTALIFRSLWIIQLRQLIL